MTASPSATLPVAGRFWLGVVLPAAFAFGCVLYIHGSGRWQELGMLPLVPFLAVPMRSLLELLALWAVAITALLVAARRSPRGKRAFE
jgi:hypothetical protein